MTHALEISPTALPTTSTEAVDDAPLLIAHLEHLGIRQLVDRHYGKALGDLSLGWVAVLWLTHILSQSSRRARHVRTWTLSHPEMLRWLTGRPVQSSYLSDEQLRDLLRTLDNDTQWSAFETALNRQMAKAYGAWPERVWLHRSSGLWYVTSEGSLQFDQSRRWWPGGMQIQTILATMEEFHLPVSIWIAPPEDELAHSIQALKQTRVALSGREVVYIGNGEVNTPEVRATIQSNADAYLCLLPAEDAISMLQHLIVSGQRPEHAGHHEHLPDGYESSIALQVDLNGSRVEWVERRLLVRSRRRIGEQETELMSRLAHAQREIAALNERKRGKRRPRTLVAMRETAEAILAEYNVTELVVLKFDELLDSRVVRRYRGRPTTTRTDCMVTVLSTINDSALLIARERLGWQILATTLPQTSFSLEDAEHSWAEPANLFERLRGLPLSLLPGVIQRADYIRGLVRFLTIALRSMVLLDAVARTRGTDLISPGWQRFGAHSQSNVLTGERLLEAFREINLTTIEEGSDVRYHITPLSPVQQRILDLLGLPPDLYQIG
jgi:transposase